MKYLKVKNYSDIFILDYPNHKFLKEEIVQALEAFVDVQNKQTNVKATMTQWNIDSVEITNLKKYVVDFLNKQYFFVEKRNQKFIFRSFWGNIYRNGDYTIEHNHLFSTFSLVYFLKSKISDSPLVFLPSYVKVKPNEGSLVIFPSYLGHKVPVYKSKTDTRITLAGNIDVIIVE